ncbi:MAG: hypothetical protein QME61_01790 [Patescibacteria group bacterium]|nr:hypothetical protein [Patescibacteria group bacterium]
MFKNLTLPLTIIIAGAIIAGVIFLVNQEKTSEKVLSPHQAAEKAINYINQNMLEEGNTASLINVVEENGVYKFRLKIGEREYDSYVTKDGKLLFTQGINLESPPSSVQKETSSEISKRDKPDIKIFVMSYCPFGLQAQKMFLPVYHLLKDKVEMGIYFVNYAMHGKKEIDENLRQYCIQKEEKEKYADYLSCFVKGGDYQGCLLEAKINKELLQSCISETDKEYKITAKYQDKSTWLNGRFPKFDIHSSLCEKYGVRGSPTIVINDKVINISPRSPEKFKDVICQSFISPPQECSQSLSTSAPSPGFGGGTGSSGGQCK